jgi:YidC/Oxa1 family membrane protein insertase
MPNESNRNLIIFMVIAMGVLVAYQYFVMDPAAKKRMADQKAKAAVAAQTHPAAGQVTGPDGNPVAVLVSREQAMGPAALRRPIHNSQLAGSLSLKGGRIDDLSLTQYHETLDKASPAVRLLSPEGAANAWFADFGWSGQNVPGLPTADTVWTLQSGSDLAPGKPVVLTYTSPQNLVFTRTITLDDKFMFNVTDKVTNNSGLPVTLTPYAQVQRQGLPKQPQGHPALGANGIVQEGAIGIFGDKGDKLEQIKYPAWIKKTEALPHASPAWLGITDKYWLVAVAPDPKAAKADLTGRFLSRKVSGIDLYQTDFSRPGGVIIPAGGTASQSTYLFAGAKVVPVLQSYEKTLGLANFQNAIDWGMFKVLTQPFFQFLDFIYRGLDPATDHGIFNFLKGFHGLGNLGFAILILTVCVRLVLFPLANKSYESMTKMKKLAPLQEELKVKYKDDPAKLQQEMMAIYAREKINPLMGCLPLFLQIPVFFSVYKVLSVTIEMRHTPFLGWIHDLSGQDPTTIFNLFGLIPFHPETLPLVGALFAGNLHLGVLPLLYGFTMWLTTAMNPPAPDPMQQRIFQLMPIMFTFIMATFPVGLLIYWTWSNVLSILQQYVIMHRLKVDNPIDDFIKRVRGIGHHAEAT